MKIGYDAKRLYCNFTGLGNYSRTLVKNMLQYFPEHSYHLYTTKIAHTEATEFFYNHPKLHTHLSRATFKAYWRSRSIVKNLQKDKIDLYHGLSNEVPIGVQRSGVKAIVTIHDLISMIHPYTYPYVDRQIYNLKFRRAVLFSDRIIAISQSTKKDIITHFGIDENKIDVVYQSVDPIYYQETPHITLDLLAPFNLPQDYILSVGSVEQRKNLKIIIQAYQALPKEDRIPVVVVGRGKKYKDECVKMVERFGLQSSFIWLNQLKDNKQLKALYDNARAVVYPSIYEGLGLPVIEASLCATPVITSTVSSLPEAAGPHAYLCEPKDEQAWANAISSILNDTTFARDRALKSRKYARETFNERKACEDTFVSYQKCMQN